ncbi:hypothetical protein ACIBG7_18745 [Nonomuraea sp. NPDC050328]|uniref:hypothetical protein n=1 Tax=Nonomuraea sp. NPDC050328 TaxID=3364361 RepID=UPI0037B42BDD
MSTPTNNGPGQTRPFADILRDIRNGQVANDAADALQDCVEAVRETGKKGQVVLTITIEPLKGSDHALTVSGDVNLKSPRPTPAAAVFFADQDYNLVRDDPRQTTIPGLREVGRTTTNIDPKEVAK